MTKIWNVLFWFFSSSVTGSGDKRFCFVDSAGRKCLQAVQFFEIIYKN